ncbi:MAG: serine hydrolase domain-containing protein [Pseudomonadota bacterium]
MLRKLTGPLVAALALCASLETRADLALDDVSGAVLQSLESNNVAGAAVVIVKAGEVIHSSGHGLKEVGTADRVDENTVFSLGSVSKVGNAALVLRLVAAGLLDLDTDVSQYLKSWTLPDSKFSGATKVTLRLLLSHTAGFNQWGYRDYSPGEALPSAIQTLNGSGPSKSSALKFIYEPGTANRYSGGGVTVSQVIVEDVTGLSYEQAARKYLFEPLGMTRSTYQNPLPASWGNIAKAHGEDGRLVALPRGWEAMPEMAASGLWSSAADLTRLITALNDSIRGESDFLPQDIAQDMADREQFTLFGLGPVVSGQGETHAISHEGANDHYRAWFEVHTQTGDAFILLTNGGLGHLVTDEVRAFVSEKYDWNDVPSRLDLSREFKVHPNLFEPSYAVIWWGVGAAVFVGLCVVIIRRSRSARS